MQGKALEAATARRLWAAMRHRRSVGEQHRPGDGQRRRGRGEARVRTKTGMFETLLPDKERTEVDQ